MAPGHTKPLQIKINFNMSKQATSPNYPKDMNDVH